MIGLVEVSGSDKQHLDVLDSIKHAIILYDALAAATRWTHLPCALEPL